MRCDSWPGHRPEEVDKKGLAVALAFLIGITMLAGGRGDRSAAQNSSPEPERITSRLESGPPTESVFDGPAAAFSEDRNARRPPPFRH
ncbi:hypothetical protein [Nitrospira moscoviensis]|uniref:Uncharacterized protein n=1 Tax=Nitrospira moscoviensis TaxID=42253 RepID=A0A0K2GCP1_NITMO|nr:hypothetical protein [Nitrospira moscoviensis]ALA58629.1 hypothetical protein NITMOv2_2213 [Nitrospira moscoviensis]